MRQLAVGARQVALETLVAGRGEVDERPGELAIAAIRRLVRGATELPDRPQILALAQVGLPVEERALEESTGRRPGRSLGGYALSHRNPTGEAGGASGLRGNPATGSVAL